jgi:hypothetical protein
MRVRLSDETVRGPDVVFIRRERLAQFDFEHYSTVAPTWVLDPESETVNIYLNEGSFRMLGPEDVIDAPDLLPGFSASVRSFFE